MATVTRKVTRRPDKERPIKVGTLEQKFAQWATIRHEIKMMTDRMEALKKDLSQVVDNEGWTDEKGSRFLSLHTGVEVAGQVFRTLKRERRVSVSLDEGAAESLLSSKGLLERAQKTVVVLDHDELFVLNQEGLITDAELDSLFNERVSFAFKPLAEDVSDGETA